MRRDRGFAMVGTGETRTRGETAVAAYSPPGPPDEIVKGGTGHEPVASTVDGYPGIARGALRRARWVRERMPRGLRLCPVRGAEAGPFGAQPSPVIGLPTGLTTSA